MRIRRQEEGTALLIVIWMLLLLSLLAAAFVATSRSALLVAGNEAESARAEALADAGIARAALALSEVDPALRWQPDGTPHVWRFGGGTVTVSMLSEGGKIDINAAPEDVLESVFRNGGADDDASERLAKAIMDKRGAVGAPGPQDMPEGAIISATQPFATIDDIAQLPDMTAALFHAVEPLVTVQARVATIDPMTASREVLLSLPGADAAEIDDFFVARSAYDPSQPALPVPPPSIARYLAAGALSAATIRADAVTDTGARFIREALVQTRDPRGVPFAVVRWTEAFAP